MTPPKAPRRAEERGRPEGNLHGETKGRTHRRGTLLPNLVRVNEAARRDKSKPCTVLLHHVYLLALEHGRSGDERRAGGGRASTHTRNCLRPVPTAVPNN